MLRADVEIAEKGAQALVGDVWTALSPTRQAVLINMTFNLVERVSSLKTFWRHYVLPTTRPQQTRCSTAVGHTSWRPCL